MTHMHDENEEDSIRLLKGNSGMQPVLESHESEIESKATLQPREVVLGTHFSLCLCLSLPTYLRIYSLYLSWGLMHSTMVSLYFLR